MRVELNPDNYTKCLCPVCPVQRASACVAAKRDGWRKLRLAVGDLLEEYPDHPEFYEQSFAEIEASELGRRHNFLTPDATEMIELYCCEKVGKTDCSDLDTEKPCQCPDCSVWEKHELRSAYFCMGKGFSGD